MSDFLEDGIGDPGVKGTKGLVGFPGRSGPVGQTGEWRAESVSLVKQTLDGYQSNLILFDVQREQCS